MVDSPTPPKGSFERARLPATQLTANSDELLNGVPSLLLQEIVEQALQATHATGAAIALEHQGELICRAVAGDCVPEIGASVNQASGITGVCAASGTTQLCSNTELDSRTNADACRELGVRAIIVAPLLHQDQFLGLIEVFSRRPFAFGMHDLQALEDLANRFTATLRLGAGSPKVDTAQEPPGVDAAPELLAGERSQRRFSGVRQFSLYALAVIACILIGFYAGFHWVWQPLGPMTNAAEGQITSTPPALPAWLSRSDVVQGTLMQSVDPTYPADALRQRLQGQVVLQIWISKDGSVYAAKTMRGDPILSQAALEAVRHWRFSPYRMNDKPFDVPAQITFEFNLAR